MDNSEIRQLKYIVESHKPWVPGKCVTGAEYMPAYHQSAWWVNMLLMNLNKTYDHTNDTR